MKSLIISALIRAIKTADKYGLNPVPPVSNGGIRQTG
jgi:hypothetical protein